MIENFWYAISLGSKIKHAPMSLKCFDMELVLWRDASGKVLCAEDRCPHRSTKLSLGEVVDGQLACGFHGFRFNHHGQCTLIPANGKGCKVSKALKLNTYVVEESRGIVWLWWGDKSKSVKQLIPEFSEFENSDKPYFEMQGVLNASFCRIMEANLDFSHFFFVHRNYFTSQPTMTRGKDFHCTIEDDRIDLTGFFCKDSDEPQSETISVDGSVIFPAMATYSSSLESPENRLIFYHAPISKNQTSYILRYYIPKGRFSFLQKFLKRWLLLEVIWKLYVHKQDLCHWQAQDREDWSASVQREVLASSCDVGISMYHKLWRQHVLKQSQNSKNLKQTGSLRPRSTDTERSIST